MSPENLRKLKIDQIQLRTLFQSKGRPSPKDLSQVSLRSHGFLPGFPKFWQDFLIFQGFPDFLIIFTLGETLMRKVPHAIYPDLEIHSRRQNTK